MKVEKTKMKTRRLFTGQIGAVEIVSISKLALEPWNLELMPALEKEVRKKLSSWIRVDNT